MEICQEVLRIPVRGKKTYCTDITKSVQRVVSRSAFTEGIVLIHTLNTTTGLTKSQETAAGYEATTGFLVQENEPLLLEDLGETLNEGAEKFLQALPQIASGRERFLDYVPRNLLIRKTAPLSEPKNTIRTFLKNRQRRRFLLR